MTDIAALGLRVDGMQDVDRAAGAIDRLVQSAVDAERSTARMGGSFTKANQSLSGFSAIAARAAKEATYLVQQVQRLSDYEIRNNDIQAYGQELDRLRAKYNPLFAASKQYEAELDELNRAHRVGAINAQEHAAALTTLNTRFQQAGTVARTVGTNYAALGGSMSGIAAQFQDIGVTAAMGMNPLIIGLQQGTQIAGQMEVAMARGASATGVFTAAFRSLLSPITAASIGITVLLSGIIQAVDWAKTGERAMKGLADVIESIAPYAATAAAGLALLYAPAILGGVASLTSALIGVARAAGGAAVAFALANPATILVAGIAAAIGALYVFRDAIKSAIGVDVIGVIGQGANFVLNSFIAAFNDIRFVWNNFGNVMGAAVIGGVNIAINAINGLIKKATESIDGLIALIRKLPGMDDTPGVGSALAISPLDNPFADLLGDAVAERNKQLAEIMGRDTLGAFIKGAKEAGKSAADWLRNLTFGEGDKNAKKLRDETQALLDTLLPLDAALRDHNRNLALLNLAYASGRITSDQYATALDNLNASYAKQVEDLAPEAVKAAREQVKQAKEQTRALQQQIRTFGMSESAVMALAAADTSSAIAKLEATRASELANGASEERVKYLGQEIDALKELQGLQQGLATLQGSAETQARQKAAWEDWAQQVKGIFDNVQRSLTDAIIDGGRNGFDALKRSAKALVLNVVLNPIMGSLQNAVTSTLGGVFGGGGGLVDTAGGIKSAYDAFSGGLNQTLGKGIGWVGEKLGSATLQSFASGLSGTAWTASSPMFALSSALPATAGWAGAAAGLGGVAPSLAGVAAGPGLAASLGTSIGTTGAAAAGGLAGVGSAIGAALPWVGGALAIGSLLGGDLFGGGPPATRHAQRTTAELMNGQFGITSIDDRQAAGSEQAALAAAQSAVTQANDMFARIGVNAAFESFYAVMESSVLGDRQGVASGGALRIGDQLRNVGVAQSSDMTLAGFGGWSPEEMGPRLATDIQLTMLEAFQQVGAGGGLPDALYSMIEGVFIRGLDESAAQDLAARFTALTEGALAFMQAADVMPHLQRVSLDAAVSMVRLAGSVDNLMAAEQSYYQNFYTEAERQGHAVEQLTGALADAGFQMPALVGSLDEMLMSYRALVDAQDINTEAGRQARWALIQASDAFAEVAQSADAAAAASVRAAQEQAQAVQENARAVQENARALEQAGQLVWDTMLAAGDSAFSALTRSVSAEKTRLQKESDAIAQTLRDSISTVSTTVSELTNLTGRLTSTAQSMAEVAGGEAQSREWAQQRISRALSVATLTGVLPQGVDFESALRIIARPSEGLFGSFEDYQADFLRSAHDVSKLNDLAGDQLSVEQRTLDSLEKQLTESQQQHSEQISRLDEMLDYQRQRLDMETGAYQRDLSIPEALAGITEAIIGINQARGEVDSTRLWDASSYLAANPDLLSGYRQFGAGQDINEWLRQHYDQYGMQEGRSFAVGTNYVPRNMRAQLHEGEAVVPAYDNTMMVRGFASMSSREDEVRALRREQRDDMARLLRRLDEIERHTETTAASNAAMADGRTQQRVVIDGVPGVQIVTRGEA